MRNIIICILCFCTVSPFAFGEKYTKDIQRDISILNSYLDQQDVYRQQKEERIALIKSSLTNHTIPLEERFTRTYMLYEEYSTYKYDSMYVYADSLCSIALHIGDANLIVKAELAIANSFLWGGLFTESKECLTAIDTTNTSKQTQIEYLNFLFDLTFESGLYARYNEVLFPRFKKNMEHIISLIEEISPENAELIYRKKVQLAFHNQENDKALEYGLKLKKMIESKDSISISYSELLGDIGYNYVDSGDTITGMGYMTHSAILAIKQGSRRYSAMRKIAETTYATGYLNDAYRYIQLSMENAKFFGSRYRVYEASKILPKVDTDLYNFITRQKAEITNLFIIISIFAVILLISIGLFIRKNRKLKYAESLLHDQNLQLTESNKKITTIIHELSEANIIKESGIRQLFTSNIELYNKLETFQKGILRKIKARQTGDLVEFVNNSELFSTRDKAITDFDKMFLRLFPDFIESFNNLLQPDARIIIEGKDSLTPELRIFALIRLGFKKNETIAHFLDYSVSTVKNYKTKIKKSSVIPNDEFESHVMQIASSQLP